MSDSRLVKCGCLTGRFVEGLEARQSAKALKGEYTEPCRGSTSADQAVPSGLSAYSLSGVSSSSPSPYQSIFQLPANGAATLPARVASGKDGYSSHPSGPHSMRLASVIHSAAFQYPAVRNMRNAQENALKVDKMTWRHRKPRWYPKLGSSLGGTSL